jgi:hypothetical protein
MGTWNSPDRETVSGTDFGDRMGVVLPSSCSVSSMSFFFLAGLEQGIRRVWLPLRGFLTHWISSIGSRF